MWTPFIIMGHPCLHDASQVMLGQRDHTVQAFAPQRTDEPFAQRVRLRTLWWRFEHTHHQVTDALIELLREDAIPSMDEEAVAMISRDRFAQLLHRPVGRGVCRHIAMHNTAGRVWPEHKHTEKEKKRAGPHTANQEHKST